jgi:predicted permease
MLKQIWIDLRVRVSALFGRRALNARAREEMEFHLAMRERQLMDRGVPVEEARSRARQEFGNRLLLQENTIDSWRYSAVQNFLQDIRRDLRYAARSLARTPAFAAAAIATIALGIGVNAGIFTVLNGVLYRELPSADAHELVSIFQTTQGLQNYRIAVGPFSTVEYRAYRDRTQMLSGVLAYSNAPPATLGGDFPRGTLGTLVACNYFTVLRQPPTLGRALAPRDCEPGAEPVVVLGYDLWTTTFAAAPEILGRTVELNRQIFTVVGIAAEGTYGGSPYNVGYFAPLSAEPLLRPNNSRYENVRSPWLNLIGRRREGVGLEQVSAELGVIAAQIDAEQPGRSTTLTIERAKPMTVPPFLRGPAMGAAPVLMAAFGLILLIACANVGNLLLARGTAKSQEIGIRLSLGASRAHVVRQLLTESMLISIAGGLLGSVLALWSFQGLVALALPRLTPPEIPTFAWDLSPDFRVLTFATVLTLGTGILFGLLPALRVSKPDLNAVIKQDSAGTGSGRRGGRLRGTLVGVQVALSMTLMIAAGLLLRGLYSTYATDPGFDYRDVAYVTLEFGGTEYTPQGAGTLRQRLMEEVKALPGVDAVAYAMREPLGEGGSRDEIRLPGWGENETRRAELNAITPGYFSMLGLSIVRGRAFTEAESANAGRDAATRPVIVSETTARNLWPDGDALGRTLLRGDITLQVVGVAADAQVTTLGQIDSYYVYEPAQTAGSLLVKTRTNFAVTASNIRAIVRAHDPTLIPRVRLLEANLEWWRGVSGIISTLGAGLGALALVLASVGIYGVVSYSVTRRSREIGIRLALGAGSGNVLGLMLRQTMSPVIVGATIGVAAASAISGILSSVLFGVSPADPIGLGGAALLVLGVALAAGVMAAGPVTRADPTAALRHE